MNFNRKRREVLKLLAIGALSPWHLLTRCALADRTLAILHTNDTHSHLDPEAEGPRQGWGGIARRATLLRRLRRKYAHHLLVDAGDFFQGTPYFNFWKGQLEIEVMNRLGYDVATIGNHEFDYGIDNLARQLQRARFVVVNTNYRIRHDKLAEVVKPFHIVRRAGWKIGIVGAGIDLKGLVPDPLWQGVEYQDARMVNEVAQELKAQHNCDMVICLSHLGFKGSDDRLTDPVLARESTAIDVIVGGHSHTVLNPPRLIPNQKGVPVVVAQAGWAGHFVGVLTFGPQSADSLPFLGGQMHEVSSLV